MATTKGFKPTRIIWHHTADPSKERQAGKVNLYHKTRGFPVSSLGFYGGYHYLIEWNGFVHRYRVPEEQGYHDADENHDSIGICLAGNFNSGKPSNEQASSAADLLRNLTWNYQIALNRVEPHRLGDTTDCPGKNLADDWIVQQFRARWPQTDKTDGKW